MHRGLSGPGRGSRSGPSAHVRRPLFPSPHSPVCSSSLVARRRRPSLWRLKAGGGGGGWEAAVERRRVGRVEQGPPRERVLHSLPGPAENDHIPGYCIPKPEVILKLEQGEEPWILGEESSSRSVPGLI
ncbi:putative zinc finger protein 487 [Camelus dromedarius]|uniref:putative zinc finger protein 487 n=1 Tax=Camelus dromedarius TaxID=9838 RepID=UPI0031194CBF